MTFSHKFKSPSYNSLNLISLKNILSKYICEENNFKLY